MKRILFVILCLSAAISGFSQQDLQPAATVNLIRTEAITVRQLRTQVQRYEQANNRTFTQAERLQILDVMINERLVLQGAERDRVTVTDNEVSQQITALRNNLAQQLGRQPTDAEYAQAVMNDSGLDVNAFREEIRKQMIMQKYLMQKKGDLINSVRSPTEEEIVREYNLLRSELMRPETIRFTMIQVPYGADAAARSRARTLMDNLIREINNDPARFDDVVSRSVAPNSGYQAGDAGYIPRTQEARNALGQQFMDIAFNLRQGQVSQIIEGAQGYQVIKVTENHAPRLLELNDIFQLGTRVTVREYLGQMMLQQRQQNIINQASQELVAEFRSNRTFTVFESNIRW